MPTQRQIQMGRRLAEEISRILLREVDDPLVRLVTVTDVELTPDLKHARVFFSAIGAGTAEEALRGLRRARKFIQQRLAEQAELRFTPTLEVRHDPTAQRAQRVEAILRQIADEGHADAHRGAAQAGTADDDSTENGDGMPGDPQDP
jgi:ribosome-binding factor A